MGFNEDQQDAFVALIVQQYIDKKKFQHTSSQTAAGVAGLAEVSRLLWRTNILLVIGLSSPLPNLGLRFLQLKFWHLWHAHSVLDIIFWRLNK